MIISKRSTILLLIEVLISSSNGMVIVAYVPAYLVYLGIESWIIQLVTTIFPLTLLVFPPILGKFSDMIQKRFLFILIGTIGLLFTFFMLTLIRDLITITLLLFSYGFFRSSSGISLVLFQEIVENDKKLITYYNACTVAGWAVATQGGGIYIDAFGVQNLFVFAFIFSIINIGVVVFIKEHREQVLKQFNSRNKEEKEGKISLDQPIKSPISQSIYYSLFFRHFGTRPIYSILAILMAFYLTSNTEIGFLLGINPLIQFFLILIIGKIITEKNEKVIIVIGFVLSALALLGYFLSIDFWSFLICQILISFSYAMFFTAIQIYIAQNTTPENKGKYVGYARSSMFFGGFVGGLFFSALLISFDYYFSMIFLIGFPMLSALIILLTFKRKSKRL